MPRFTSPRLMVLRACELAHLREDDRTRRAIEITAEWSSEWHFRPAEVPSPVILRWSTNSPLGFPLRPFELYRRVAKFPDLSVIVRKPQAVEGTVLIQWGLDELYIVTFLVFVSPGGSLTIEALNEAGQPVPGMRQVFTANSSGSFTGVGIAALRVSGSGRIESIQGLHAEEVVAMADWELIEIVGLPLRFGEVKRGYDTSLAQGVVNPVLDGYDAAVVRLLVASILSEPPPSTGDPTIPTPAWGIPDPFSYRFSLCDRSPSAMEMVRACLETADNTDPDNLQTAFRFDAVTPGPRQSNLPGAAPSTSLPTTAMSIPVVGVTLLSATTDSFAATSLGYGTVDFPSLPQAYRNNSALEVYQYMVVGEFETAFGRLEIAALSNVAPPPVTPSGFQAQSAFFNRPDSVDGVLSESVELSWLLTPVLQGYAIAASRVDGDVTLLNQPHRDGWHYPYIPEHPYPQNGTIPAGTRTRFADNHAPVPYTGSQLSEYIVAGLDVFGRWSVWRKVAHTAGAPPVQKPGIHSVNFVPNGPPATDGSIPYIIEIEFSWNQEDRRVHAIDFFGRYFALTPGADPGSAPASFQFSNTLAGTTALRVLFDASGVPRLPSGSPFSIDLPVVRVPLNPPDPGLLKYVLRLRGASILFSTGTTRVGYAVYAAARERVREPSPDTDMAVSLASAPTAAVIATVVDPRPPDTPVVTPSLNWTALPDATGRARGVLTWPAVDRAAGYVVWQATESALLQAMEPPTPESLPGTSLVTRAGALQTLLSTPDNQRRALRVFSRLNTELVRAMSLEIDLPAVANTLFAFRVSAVGDNNETSDRSAGMVIFGVPRRNQPSRPRLLLRSAPSGGVYVICLATAGVVAAGFNLFRVRSPALLVDSGTYGEPHLTSAAGGWQDLGALPTGAAWNPVRAAIRTLPQPVTGKAIYDPVPASWRPYYYAAVALGIENLAAGDYRGESPPSASQEVFVPPPNPPALVVTGFTTAADGSKLLAFTADLPVRPTSLGAARLTLYEVRVVGGRARREKLIDLLASNVIEGPLPTTGTPASRRGAPDAAGVVAYEVRLAAGVTGGAVVATDPVGRAVECSFPT